MSNQQKEYAYSIRGNTISLVERDFTAVQNGQTLTAPSIDLPRGLGTWNSPKSDVDQGLEIEFTSVPEAELKDESSVIPVTDYLAKALIYYIKAKLVETERDLKSREYFMKQFHKMVEKNENAKIHGSRQIIAGANAIR